MKVYNRSGNVAYEVLPSQLDGIATRHDAHVEGKRIVHDVTGRTLFFIGRPIVTEPQK